MERFLDQQERNHFRDVLEISRMKNFHYFENISEEKFSQLGKTLSRLYQHIRKISL